MSLKKKYINFKRFSFLFLCLLSVLISPLINLPVKAQVGGGDPNATSLTISPPSYELTGNPGDTIENTLKVTNRSINNTTYEAIVEDFRVEGAEGLVTISGDDTDPNSFSKWFEINPKTFGLKAGETKNIQFSVKVPKDAEPGGHFASVLFQPKAIESLNNTGAQVLQRVGSLVLMTVSGAIIEKAAVEKFYSKTVTGEIQTIELEDKSQIYRLVNEKVDKTEAKNYFSQGPVAFDLLLKNDGNVFYRPKGTATIYNIFGQKVDEITIDPKNVFPGGERRITVVWPKKNLWGIRYTAKVIAQYGQQNPQTLTADASFWAFPLPIAITIAIVLVLLILLRKRLVKAISILAKG